LLCDGGKYPLYRGMAKTTDEGERRRFYSNRLHWMQRILADPEMPERYKLVAISIALRINPPHYVSFPEMETIALDTAVSKSTVIRAVKYLEAANWLYVHRETRKVNRYALLMSNVL